MLNNILRAFLICNCISLVSEVKGQEIHIGEKVPDVILTNLFHYKSNSAKLISDFGGKPLLIDFWFAHCAPCINSMPKLDSMQMAFGDSISILMATYEKDSAVWSLFSTNPIVENVMLPSVINDSVLIKLFPHKTEPHEIWIDKNGIVQAITEHDEVTWKNVRTFIEGKSLNLPLKHEMDDAIFWGLKPFAVIDYDLTKGEGMDQYSFISKYSPYMKSSTWPAEYDSTKSVTRIKMINTSKKTMYQIAYGQELTSMYATTNDFVTDFGDTISYNTNISIKNRCYCYDLIIKDTSIGRANKMMQQDLDRYFQLKSSVDFKPIDCYVLKRMTSVDKLRSKKNVYKYSEKQGRIIIDKIKWGRFVQYRLNSSFNLTMHIMDETNIDKMEDVDLNLTSNWSDLNMVNSELSEYNLILSIEKRFRKVITLTRD
jgi:thiol-disulfide isomerase/thioredoxin